MVFQALDLQFIFVDTLIEFRLPLTILSLELVSLFLLQLGDKSLDILFDAFFTLFFHIFDTLVIFRFNFLSLFLWGANFGSLFLLICLNFLFKLLFFEILLIFQQLYLVIVFIYFLNIGFFKLLDLSGLQIYFRLHGCLFLFKVSRARSTSLFCWRL